MQSQLLLRSNEIGYQRLIDELLNSIPQKVTYLRKIFAITNHSSLIERCDFKKSRFFDSYPNIFLFLRWKNSSLFQNSTQKPNIYDVNSSTIKLTCYEFY